MTTIGSAASRPQGNRSSGPRRTAQSQHRKAQSPMLAKEYIPSMIVRSAEDAPDTREHREPGGGPDREQQQPTFTRRFAGRHGAGYSYA